MQNVIEWSSDRAFSVWRYGVGHSQLLLASQETAADTGVGVQFEGVEYMRLVRTFRNLRVTTADELQWQEVKASGALTALPRPLLVLALHHDHGVGLVACSRLRIGSFQGLPTNDLDTVQLHATATA
ncbi:hypothetical protein ACIA8F_38655 [Streptomyces sp. NPDC051563]|uniref:hypothetical protein n=1 Tax=Streptomyces sp. NPDC051563 TaxID=3365659 RepID=UPI00378EEA2D